MILNALPPVTASPKIIGISLVLSGWIGRIAPRLSFLTGGPVRPGCGGGA
jgi:hypothetical protein